MTFFTYARMKRLLSESDSGAPELLPESGGSGLVLPALGPTGSLQPPPAFSFHSVYSATALSSGCGDCDHRRRTSGGSSPRLPVCRVCNGSRCARLSVDSGEPERIEPHAFGGRAGARGRSRHGDAADPVGGA